MMRPAEDGGIRWLRGLCLAVVLGALEASLIRLIGSPDHLLAVLRQAPTPGAEPVTTVLAFLTAAVELLALYLLVSLGLHLVATLPGVAGRLAGRASSALTLPLLRRALDTAIGGVLIVQAAMGPAVSAPAAFAAPMAPATAAASHLFASPATGLSPAADAIVATSAAGLASGGGTTGTSAVPATADPPTTFVPLPGWAGWPPSTGAPTRSAARDARPYTIQPDDTLWDIATAHLPPGLRTDATIDAYWRQIYQANHRTLGSDPDYILPGVTITIPAH